MERLVYFYFYLYAYFNFSIKEDKSQPSVLFGGEEEEICGTTTYGFYQKLVCGMAGKGGTTTYGFYQKLFCGMAGKGDGLARVLEKVWRPVLTTIVMIFMIIIMSIKSFIYHFRLTLEYIMLV